MKNLIAILISINLIFFGNFLFSKSSKSELNVKSEKNYIAQAEDSDDADDDDNDDETESKAVKPDNKKPEAETIKADADKTKTETTTNTTAKLPKAVRTPSMLSKIARIKRGDNIILKEIRFDTFKNLLLIINEDAIRNNKTIDEELAVNPIEKRKIIKTLIGGIYNADPRVRLASVYGMKIILKSLENVKIPEKTKSGVPYTEDEKEKLNKKYKKIYYRTILDIHPETRRAWYLETVKELKSYTPAYDKTKPQKSPISWRDSLQNDKEDGDSKFTYKDGKKYYTPAKNWKNEYLGLTIKGEPILQTVYNELNMLDLYVTRIIVVSRIQAGTLGREDLRRADPRILLSITKRIGDEPEGNVPIYSLDNNTDILLYSLENYDPKVRELSANLLLKIYYSPADNQTKNKIEKARIEHPELDEAFINYIKKQQENLKKEEEKVKKVEPTVNKENSSKSEDDSDDDDDDDDSKSI